MDHHDPQAPDRAAPGEHLPEGRERPPPGVRLMSIVRWSLVALAAVAALGAWVSYANLTPGAAHSAVLYRCPMHPSVLQDHPGECPICGMDLVLVDGAGASHQHGEAASGGKGEAAEPPMAMVAGAPSMAAAPPKMEMAAGSPAMAAEPAEVAMAGAEGQSPAAAAPHQHLGAYWCPMHHDFTSDNPKERCPTCHMRLEKRPVGGEPGGDAAGASEASAASGPRPGSPVPGLIPVELGSERTQLMGLRTAPVKRQRLASELRTVGFVAADEGSVVVVSARINGWVQELKVTQTGERVTKGQALATLYSPELSTAQQVFLNSAGFSRQAGQPGAGTVSGIEMDARRRLELLGVSLHDIDTLEERGSLLDDLPVRSPVNGYVVRKGAVPGLFVQPGVELFQLADLSHVWVLAEVYEQDVGRVRVGQAARVTFPAYPGRAWKGQVTLLYPAVSSDTRTLQARIVLSNRDLELKPGMYGEAAIDLGGAEGLTVPPDAVIDTGELQYVFVAGKGGRFEPRTVRLGLRGAGAVQVLAGLAEGERVVSAATFLVDSESRLRSAVERTAGAPAAPPLAQQGTAAGGEGKAEVASGR